jgi:hypothetical protein
MTLDALVRKILTLLYGPALLAKGDGKAGGCSSHSDEFYDFLSDERSTS